MEKFILSADLGKHTSKVIGRNRKLKAEDIKEIKFRTQSYLLEDGFIEKQGNSFLVEYDNKEYIIGDQGKEKSYVSSKTNIIHKLSCYTSITRFLEPGTKDNEIYMVLACPLSVLQIQEAKEEYKTFLKGDGPISIKVDGEEYNFTIKDITIKAEGTGIVYLEPNVFKNKAVLIVDIGGLNLSGYLYINGVCNKDQRFIEECGSNRLLELTREQLTKYKNGNIVSETIAEKALDEGGLKKSGVLDNESTKYINAAKDKFLNEVIKAVEKNNIDIEQLDKIVFVGGTSLQVKENIEDRYKHSYVPDNAQMATVQGLYKVAFKKYQDVTKGE